jgi:parallel beta-helix repeat protein
MKVRKFVYLAAGVFAVAGCLVLAGPAGAARQIHASNPSCGSTIGTSVTLTSNMTCSTSPALIIGGTGITLNLNGYTLSETNSSYEVIDNYDGCNGSGCSDFTLTNGTVSGGTYGLDNEGASTGAVDGTTVTSVNFVGQSSYGVYLEYSTDSNVSNNTVSETANDSLTGIEDDYGSSNAIENNTLNGYEDANTNTGTGIETYYVGGDMIENNTVSAWGDYGLYDDDYSAGLVVYQNVFAGNSYGIEFDSGDAGDAIAGNYVKNSVNDGILDYYSNYQAYTNNVVSSNGGYGIELYADDDGVANASNNVSRFNFDDGFYFYELGDTSNYGGPSGSLDGWNTISGNTAQHNGGEGFDDYYSAGETYTNNTATSNSDSGFYLDYPIGATVKSNTSTYNVDEGFDFEDNYAEYAPSSVWGNTAEYNADYGFYGDYPVAGSGNQGGGTNSSGDCFQFAGCS